MSAATSQFLARHVFAVRSPSRRCGAVISLTLWVLLPGCAAVQPFGAATPEYDRHFGDSIRQVRAAQTLDPGATARNLGKTAEMDGTAAKHATDRYQDSFKTPPPTFTVFGAPVQNVQGGQ